jgi:hypothetical protein
MLSVKINDRIWSNSWHYIISRPIAISFLYFYDAGILFFILSPILRIVRRLQMNISCDISKDVMDFSTIFLRVDRKDIYYVRFIFEGYDGMGIVSTKDPDHGQLTITYPTGSRYDILELIKALQDEGIVKEVTES